MILSGKEALDLDLKKSEGKREFVDRSGAYYNAGDIPAGDSVKVRFLEDIETAVISWLEHKWWVTDKYGKNPNGDVVTKDVTFPSLKESWTSPDETCPGFIMESKGTQRYAAVVLIEVDEKTGIEERVFTFPKSIWEALKGARESLRKDFGDDASIADYWYRISNSGEGANRYGVQFTGIPFKPASIKGLELKYNVRDFVRIRTFSEAVNMMREAGLPIDEKLTALNLDENGNKIETPVTEETLEAVAE